VLLEWSRTIFGPHELSSAVFPLILTTAGGCVYINVCLMCTVGSHTAASGIPARTCTYHQATAATSC